jgi:hypothetical protein
MRQSDLDENKMKKGKGKMMYQKTNLSSRKNGGAMEAILSLTVTVE